MVFSTWVKADFETILERHAVDIRKALAEFREASARRHDTPSSRILKGSASTTGTQDRRGREGAIENQIAGKWHIIIFARGD